jgi:hypothetical protein
VDRTLVDAAVKSIDALIDSELHSAGPGRYGRIIKLSRQAHDLVQLSVTRVKDAAGMQEDIDECEYVADGHAMMVARQGGLVNGGGGADNVDLLREVVAGMQMAFKPRETPPPSPIDGLHSLLDLRERLIVANKKVDVVDAQINDLMARVAKEDLDAGPVLLASVARPVVLRRHPTGADVDWMPGDHGGALGAGEGGADGPVEAGGEEEVAARG